MASDGEEARHWFTPAGEGRARREIKAPLGRWDGHRIAMASMDVVEGGFS